MKQALAILAAATLMVGCDWLGTSEKCDRCECAAGCCESGVCEHNCGCDCVSE